MSGLKFNFHKSKLCGVHIEANQIEEGERILGCQAEARLLNYLGLKIGSNHHKLETWAELIHKIRSRIASWDGKNISLSGRATLVQSVLSAVRIYYLSFFILQKQVIKTITKIQSSFLWGGDDDNCKIPWVKWSTIYKRKEEVGLGIKEMGKFNRALVGNGYGGS
ncbi:hypothetical protein ACS0TY_006971 [Phlomoides rotata]